MASYLQSLQKWVWSKLKKHTTFLGGVSRYDTTKSCSRSLSKDLKQNFTHFLLRDTMQWSLTDTPRCQDLVIFISVATMTTGTEWITLPLAYAHRVIDARS